MPDHDQTNQDGPDQKPPSESGGSPVPTSSAAEPFVSDIADDSPAARAKLILQRANDTQQSLMGLSATSADPAVRFQAVLMGAGIWGFFGTLLARINEEAKAWIDTHWLWLIAAYSGMIGLYILWSYLRGKSLRVSEVGKNAMIVFGGIPIIVGGIITISQLRGQDRVFAIHSIFILCVCLLPGAMYYVFIVTRKPSILNKYVANLARLGVLSNHPREKENEKLRRRRIESYFQRFEALYGPLDYRDAFLHEMCSLNTHDAVEARPVPGAAGTESPRGTRLGSIFPPSVAAQILLTTVLTAMGFLLVLTPKWTGDDGKYNLVEVVPSPPVFIPEFSPVNMAFLGAYFFNIQMLFHRFLRRDISVNAYVSASLRMVMAVIGAWVLAVIWGYWFIEKDSQFTFISLLSKGFETLPKGDWPLLVLAFVIGVFPRTLWQLIEAMLKKLPTVSYFLPSVESDQGLSELDGMTIWTETRLDEEDVENVPNMATADMVSLLLQTKFPEDRLVKWIDQAILLTYLGPSPKNTDSATPSPRSILTKNGITTASELMAAHIAAAKDPQRLDQFEGMLGDERRYQIRHIVEYLREQSTNFNLIAAWRGLIVAPPTRRSAVDVTFPGTLSVDQFSTSAVKKQ